MANEIKTRILLKYDSQANWEASSFILKTGEAAVCEMTPVVQGGQSVILIKYGNGKDKFIDLPWASALAADVYAWAKQSPEDFIKWVNENIEHPVITTGTENGTIAVDGTDVAVKGLGSAAYTSADAYAPADIDTGVHAVDLATGETNGTVKLTVDGADKEVAVAGLQDAAYATVANLNATAKGYADAVEGKLLGASTDAATANTIYGAKAAAAAAQGTANEAKTKIDTFLGTITPDGSQDIIDTLQEINNYVGEHGEEFATLSGKVTNIENGTTHTVAKSLDTEAVEQVKGIKVNNAVDADKLGGTAAADYALKTELDNYVTSTSYATDKSATEDALADRYTKDETDGLIAGLDLGDENVIESVKVNNTALAVTDKAVNIDLTGYVLKSEATGYNDILTKTDATTLYRAKQDKIVPADLSADVFIFDCGSATKNID